MSVQTSAKSYVAGRWLDASGERFHSVNPATGEPVADCGTSEIDEIDEACQAASEAARDLAGRSGATIANFLRTLATEIENLGDSLIETGMAESGLPEARLQGERGRTCGQIRAFADLVEQGSWVDASIDTALPDREPLPKPDLRAVRVAIGPVAVFGASNFPFAFGSVGGDTASALAAGNPVVIKGHPSHPGTNSLFAQALDAAIKVCEFPAGTASLLQGTGIELGGKLVEHPAIKAVGFTGSLGGGRALMDIAAAREEPIPVFAEMGSINPVFLMPDALANRGADVAAGMAQSVAMGTGQFCTSPGLLVTLKDADFAAQLQKQMSEAPRGVMLNQGIANTLCRQQQALVDVEPLELLTGGANDRDPIKPFNSLYRVSASDFLSTPELLDEAFGPSAILVECDNEEQLLMVAEAMEGNLTATVHTDGDEGELLENLTTRLAEVAGRVLFNGFPTGVEVCPSMQHGGPYPASSAAGTTSVGTAAIDRFTRRVSFQNCPQSLLPAALRDDNPLGIWRLVNGSQSRDAL